VKNGIRPDAWVAKIKGNWNFVWKHQGTLHNRLVMYDMEVVK
jgi:hypothetical protein